MALVNFRQAARALARAPGFTVFAVTALSLGIGANTAVFSALRAVLIRPLPYHEPDRLVMIWEDSSFAGFPRNTPAPANYVDWRSRNTVFEEMAATRGAVEVLSGGGVPEELIGRRVTPGFFRVLGVPPRLGRVFGEAEDVPDPRVVVISHGLWVRRFGADPSLVGREITLTGRRTTVLGVMPPRFQFPDRTVEFWAPTGFDSNVWARRGQHFLNVVARLKAGVSLEQARAEMSALAARLAREHPATNTRLGAVVIPLGEQLAGAARPMLVALMITALLVLLIACSNVANLLLTRATARQREYAVRLALGSGRGGLITQVLAETLLLAGAACALGIALAYAAIRPLENLIPAGMRGIMAPAVDKNVLAFAAVVSVLATVAAGVIPALFVSRRDVFESLRGGALAGTGRGSRLARHSLVVAEAAVSVVLLAGAGLLIQSILRLRAEDLGFRPANLLTLRMRLPLPRYEEPARRRRFFDEVIGQARALPGVAEAGFVDTLPFRSRGNTSGFVVEGRPPFRPGEESDALIRVGTPGYLRALGVRLLEGRLFSDSDGEQAPLAAIVNETFARRFWPGESALGKRLQADRWGPGAPWRTVVGVVADLKERGFDYAGKGGIYLPFAQASSWVPETLVLRCTFDPASLAGPVRAIVRAADPEQPVTRVQTMEEILDEELAGRRRHLALMVVFASLAVALAALGIYAALAFAVTLRRREIGLRLALGATPGRVVAMIVAAGLRLALLGTVAGLAAALALGRAAAGLLYRVEPSHPPTLAAVAVLFAAVAALASLPPSIRAARLGPAAALRDE